MHSAPLASLHFDRVLPSGSTLILMDE